MCAGPHKSRSELPHPHMAVCNFHCTSSWHHVRWWSTDPLTPQHAKINRSQDMNPIRQRCPYLHPVWGSGARVPEIRGILLIELLINLRFYFYHAPYITAHNIRLFYSLISGPRRGTQNSTETVEFCTASSIVLQRQIVGSGRFSLWKVPVTLTWERFVKFFT